MDKRRAIQIMTRAVALYHADLEDQKVIFLYGIPAEVRRQLQAKSGMLLSIKSYEVAGDDGRIHKVIDEDKKVRGPQRPNGWSTHFARLTFPHLSPIL